LSQRFADEEEEEEEAEDVRRRRRRRSSLSKNDLKRHAHTPSGVAGADLKS